MIFLIWPYTVFYYRVFPQLRQLQFKVVPLTHTVCVLGGFSAELINAWQCVGSSRQRPCGFFKVNQQLLESSPESALARSCLPWVLQDWEGQLLGVFMSPEPGLHGLCCKTKGRR